MKSSTPTSARRRSSRVASSASAHRPSYADLDTDDEKNDEVEWKDPAVLSHNDDLSEFGPNNVREQPYSNSTRRGCVVKSTPRSDGTELAKSPPGNRSNIEDHKSAEKAVHKNRRYHGSNEKYPVGQKVYKEFESVGWYWGYVVSIGKYYHIKYEDSDEEDLSEEEMEEVVGCAEMEMRQRSSSGNKHKKLKQSIDAAPQLMAQDDSDSRKVRQRTLSRWAEKPKKEKSDFSDNDDSSKEILDLRRKSPRARTPKRRASQSPSRVRSFAVPSEDIKPCASKRVKSAECSAGSDKENLSNVQGDSKKAEAKSAPRERKKSLPGKGKDLSENAVSTSYDIRKVLKAPYTAGDDLPIITDPQKMFDDMIQSKLTDDTRNRAILDPLLRVLKDRPLRVATMCSGTESPILALDMLQRSIQDLCNQDRKVAPGWGALVDRILQIEHVFSCEIEPFKQAYIERNFRPPLLFRDIRDLSKDKAPTAYGGEVLVPNEEGSVDLLIAGTSCVDYSNLNNKKKEINQGGESGQTFYSMLEWVEKAKPPIVIVENVSGAPWDVKVKLFQELGYSAIFHRMDTKDYYVPQTRLRGYLFAVKPFPGNRVDERPAKWVELLKQLKRPASASLDAFMLHNDDARVLRGRMRLTAESMSTGESSTDRSGRTDWTKCETRHQLARSSEELGDMRPLTEWSESKPTQMPSFCWNDWTNAQVHRIHDLIDINTLRMAQFGLDCTYKTMVWNLSQNVDRDTMGKLGLCQCLTPTGVPYVTSRGGPLVGEELLLLQGIPADDLILTKETEENLKDLSGNAMTTTVVGAAIIAALVVGFEAIPSKVKNPSGSAGAILPTLVPRPLVVPSPVRISEDFGIYEDSTYTLGPRQLGGWDSWHSLLKEAYSSARLCVSEGPEDVLPYRTNDQALSCDYPVVCQECGQTASHQDARGRFEEHEFVPINSDSPRVGPATFRKKLLDLLPMRFVLTGFDIHKLERPKEVDIEMWDEWLHVIQNLLKSAQQAPVEYRLRTVARSHIWTAEYSSDGDGEGRIELRISSKGLTWLLFATPPTKRCRLQSLLKSPVARLTVKEPAEDSSSFSINHGCWELCLPVSRSVNLEIVGVGQRIDSWRKRLGLKGEFESEYQYEKLRITITSEGVPELKSMIDGTYHCLPKCGGACGSLRKKQVENSSDEMFFFLESELTTLPVDDTYVFSTTCHRKCSGKYRDVFLEIDRKIPYQAVHNSKSNLSLSERYVGLTRGTWIPVKGVELKPFDSSMPKASVDIRLPTSESGMTVPINLGSWRFCPAIVTCTVVVESSEMIVQECMKHGGKVELNLQKSKHILELTAFVTARVTIPTIFQKGWLLLDRSDMTSANGDDDICKSCAPAKPAVDWKTLCKGNKLEYLPVEDGHEAAEYERALKKRPHPWLLRFSVSSSEPCEQHFARLKLHIGCNPVSLVFQAARLLPTGKLPRRAVNQLAFFRKDDAIAYSAYEWRIVAHEERPFTGFPKLIFTSNRLDQEAGQPPNFTKFKLRKEQLRSLAWMLSQESTEDPFYEEEVTEAILPCLNWRAEGRIRRPVLLRGGIIADQVGYGKTVIALGLIDSAESINGAPPKPPQEYESGYIFTKATLVIVPKHLMGQWPSEIRKFLDLKKKVVVIKDMSSMNTVTIKQIVAADIVLVGFDVLSNDMYFSRLARLAGINPKSFPSGRAGRKFTSVYRECVNVLPQRVSQILCNCASAYDSIENAAQNHKDQSEEISMRLDKKKSIYKNGNKSGPTKEQPLKGLNIDPWGLRKRSVQSNHHLMTSPPLECFYWNRVIVDEFTYLDEISRVRAKSFILELKSSFRWCLSGTPGHSNFNDIRTLAEMLGVHLGVEENLPCSKFARRTPATKEKTSLESLSYFLQARSLQWHERRHEMAQAFLDRFVRQNVAEIDEIPYEEKLEHVDLPPAERAIYLELETHLQSLEMDTSKAKSTKKANNGDREYRMQKALVNASSAEEALLKCASQFNISSLASTAEETLQDVINKRRSEKESLEADIIDSIASGCRQQARILALQPNWSSVTKTDKGEIVDSLAEYLKAVQTMSSLFNGADEETNLRLQELVKDAMAQFEADPTDFKNKFGDVTTNTDDEALYSTDDELSKKRRPSNSKESVRAGHDNLTDAERLFATKLALRNHMHVVRSLGKGLCGRYRSYRFVKLIQQFQGTPTGHSCTRCGASGLDVEKMGALSSCGHSGCLSCLRTEAEAGRCVMYPTCGVQGVTVAHVVSSDKLGLNVAGSSGCYGCKLSKVIKVVQEITSKGDRLIVFCQFDDLKETIEQALQDSHIRTLTIKGTVQQQIKAINILQNPQPGKDDPRVVLLKMDDETSAGLNLTNLNHAIFVHPLLANSQHQYEAYETQAIGRIRRYGQNKTVFVWRFLANDTIDTVIFKERTHWSPL